MLPIYVSAGKINSSTICDKRVEYYIVSKG
jgi:hypothetical protein